MLPSGTIPNALSKAGLPSPLHLPRSISTGPSSLENRGVQNLYRTSRLRSPGQRWLADESEQY